MLSYALPLMRWSDCDKREKCRPRIEIIGIQSRHSNNLMLHIPTRENLSILI